MEKERFSKIRQLILYSRRFRIAAEQYIEAKGGDPTDKSLVADYASRIKRKRNAIYPLRHNLGYTDDQIVDEILNSLEE
jgi:hypothetical protein